MKFDTGQLFPRLETMTDYIKSAESIGFDGVWVSETSSDPFLPLAIAAEHSSKVELGTAIAVTFPRSPMVLAQIGWDLQRYSQGRFIMGLGPQVRAHNERRFGATWSKPVRKMRETIEAMHAIWDCWQNGSRLSYEGEFFKLNLMTPFFNPGPIEHKRPPVYISAVNQMMLKLAGKTCDGVHLHALNTRRYVDEFARLHLREGLAVNDRSFDDLTVTIGAFVIPTDDVKPAAAHEAFVRQQLSFYMSTPAYRVVLDMMGWQEIGLQLSKMARNNQWAEMPAVITDEILSECVLTGTWAELPKLAHTRYGGLVDRLSYYLPYEPGPSDEGWRATVAGFNELRNS